MYKTKNTLMLKEIQNQFPQDIINAIICTDREIFMPNSMKHLAYTLNAIPMSDMQFVSSPLTVIKMTSYLLARDLQEPKIIKNPDSVLEIGLGSGYQAVILSKLIRRVFSIERIQSLYNLARSRISKLNIMNINVKLDDGNHGWEAYAKYDRILFSTCLNQIPLNIFSQLNEGGVLVAPCNSEDGGQVIKRFIKINSRNIIQSTLEKCEFVQIRDGVDLSK